MKLLSACVIITSSSNKSRKHTNLYYKLLTYEMNELVLHLLPCCFAYNANFCQASTSTVKFTIDHFC